MHKKKLNVLHGFLKPDGTLRCRRQRWPNCLASSSVPRHYTPGHFLWGYVKDRVYQTPVNNIDDLKTRITNAIATVDDATSGYGQSWNTDYMSYVPQKVHMSKCIEQFKKLCELVYLTVCRYILIILDYKVVVNLYVHPVYFLRLG